MDLNKYEFENGQRKLVLKRLTVREFMELPKDKRWEFLFSRYEPKRVEAFINFHNKNPHVYKKFLEITNQVMEKGRGRYSAGHIFGIMRWHTDISENRAHEADSTDYKITSNWSPFYARLFVYHNPQHVLYFNLRCKDHSGTPTVAFEDSYGA